MGIHGWSTWCYNLDDVIKEATASNSRGSTQGVDKQTSIQWLIMEMEVLLSKLPYLLMRGLRVDWCPSCEGELLLSDQQEGPCANTQPNITNIINSYLLCPSIHVSNTQALLAADNASCMINVHDADTNGDGALARAWAIAEYQGQEDQGRIFDTAIWCMPQAC